MPTRFFSLPTPRIFAHRGYSAKYPENTLAAFAAAEKWTSYFELDVWLSREGIPVVQHDEVLLGPPLYLSDVIQAFPQAFLNIEIKQDASGAESCVLDLLNQLGAIDRCLIAAEKHAILERVRARWPQVPTSMSVTDGLEFVSWLRHGRPTSYHPKASALQAPVKYNDIVLADPDLIAAAHSLGIEVHFWTINDPTEMKRLLAMGADGIITDDPELAIAELI